MISDIELDKAEAVLSRGMDPPAAEALRYIRFLRTQVAALLAEREEVAGALKRMCDVIADDGCSCDCDHDSEGHDDDCDRCLGCRIDAARAPLKPKGQTP
jgi:hypothetical protein